MTKAIRAALRKGGAEAVLDALLAAWRDNRHPRLSAQIQRWGRIAAHDVAPLDMTGKKAAVQLHYLERAASQCAAELTPLLDALLEKASLKATRERVKQLASWPADPRLAEAGLHRLSERHYQDPGALTTQLFGLIIDHGDASMIARTEALAEQSYGSEPNCRLINHRALKMAAKLRKALGDDAPEPANDVLIQALDEAAEVRELAAGQNRDAGAEDLLQRIYDDPADDQARLVYGDLLAERGDPHGELIGLQLREGKRSAAERKREKALIAEHGESWLGELLPVLLKKGLAFERGFPAVAALRHRDGEGGAAVLALAASPRWNTFCDLDLGNLDGMGELARKPALRRLRSVSCETMRALCLADPPLTIEAVEFLGPDMHGPTIFERNRELRPVGDVDWLERAPGLPWLRELALEGPPGDYVRMPGAMKAKDWRWLLRSALVGQLESLSIAGGIARLSSWLDEVDRLPELRRFALCTAMHNTGSDRCCVRFERQKAGGAWDLRIKGKGNDWVEKLDTGLRSFSSAAERARIASASAKVGKAATGHRAWARVEEALSRWD